MEDHGVIFRMAQITFFCAWIAGIYFGVGWVHEKVCASAMSEQWKDIAFYPRGCTC